jgi:hypothetical protein
MPSTASAANTAYNALPTVKAKSLRLAGTTVRRVLLHHIVFLVTSQALTK